MSPQRHTYRYRPGASRALITVACVGAGDLLLATGQGTLRSLAGLALAAVALFSAEKMARAKHEAWRPPASGGPLLDPDHDQEGPREPPVAPATAAGRRASEISGAHGEP